MSIRLTWTHLFAYLGESPIYYFLILILKSVSHEIFYASSQQITMFINKEFSFEITDTYYFKIFYYYLFIILILNIYL